jgi:PIN domain nuclease of toxin-antitoxin system
VDRAKSDYQLLPITAEHTLRAGHLPGTDKDPFDRMLAAQAIHEDIPLLSNDEQLDVFGVWRAWERPKYLKETMARR